MENFLEQLQLLPHSALVLMARDAGHDADTLHRREDLIAALVDDIPLTPSRVRWMRRKLHDFIAVQDQAFRDMMDATCLKCHKAHQHGCLDERAIVDYINNQPYLEQT